MFEFDETQRAIAAALRDYCAREIEPRIGALEKGDVSAFALMREFGRAFGLDEMVGGPLRRRAERLRGGGPGSEPSVERSGPLGDPALSAIFAMELARTSPGLCLCVTASMGCAATIAARGDADLVERYAIPVLTLERVGCWALTEPGSGSDAFAMQTSCRIEDDTVVLRGSKTFISNAPEADVFLIYARLVEDAAAGPGAGAPTGARDKQRIFPVVVERGTPGLETGPPMEKMGMHACPTGEVFLDDVRVPRGHLLGDPDRPAREAAEETLASERAAIVAMSLGVIERCLDDALAYAVERIQFGRPIAAFQLVQQKLARMYAARENVRNLVFKLIWMQRVGAATEREVSAAKWYATEAACEVALEAVQLMGGAGYMREHAPERMFRDMKLWTIGGGTSEIQQLTIAKDLLRERGVRVDLCGGYRDDRGRSRP
ncbi:MAG: acyl-CoA dehydrogenase family protein [Deltaproteobacteria bacterium]|nr:acyl-CoA dehydrogenase family protein [Deltaproteobacteria bacterium]